MRVLGRWTIVVSVVVLCACSRHEVVAGADDGSPADRDALDAAVDASDADAGAGRADAGRLDAEPAPGGECDQQDVCASCVQCSLAPRRMCNEIALRCEMQRSCVALWRCAADCSRFDEVCVELCMERSPGGRDLYVALQECTLCEACPADCRELDQWCVEAPI